MSKHEVDLAEFDFPITIKQELCGSYGGKSNKTLELVCEFDELNSPKSVFVVKDHNIVVGNFHEISQAIKCYNSFS